MQPQLESVLESRLAAVLMRELMRPCDLGGDVADIDDTFVDIELDDLELEESNDYASFEVVVELALLVSDVAPTIEFVRVHDTAHDHVITIKFPREVVEADPVPVPEAVEADPVPVPEAVEADPVPVRQSQATPVPLYSVPYERIEDYSHVFVKAAPEHERASRANATSFPNAIDWASESTEIVYEPNRSSHVILMVSVLALALALALGLGIAVFAI